MYSCGPTVYDYAHIGNFRAYIVQDIIRRTLSYSGHTITHAMNITDVGHLTSDADLGEDKLERRAAERNIEPLELARMYESAFWEDMAALNIHKPDKVLRATETIAQQIALIEKLFKKDVAYKTKQAIYFDVTKAKEYGKLTGQRLEDKEVGARDEVVIDTAKRNSADFALWFFAVEHHAHHLLRWESPWGVGFPGWHLECSAISRALLGQPFDIHLGGVDHISVHHTNEIAQSETAYDTPLAHYWVHNNFLTVNDEKMSKSLGTTYTRADLIEHGISPLAFRYFTLTAHYRSQQNVTWEALKQAQEAYRKLIEYAFMLHKDTADGSNDVTNHRNAFETALLDDINTPNALAATWAILKDEAITPITRYATLLAFDEVLGLDVASTLERFTIIPNEIRDLAEKREVARKNEEYTVADDMRQQIAKHGFDVRDTQKGPLFFPHNI